MVSLGEVAGALISQINKGRAQADMATLDVAEIYKDHPFLSSFSIPRMTLDELNIDLKVAFTAGPSSKVSLTPDSRAKMLDRVTKLIKVDLPAKYRYVQSLAQDPAIWGPLNEAINKEISEIVPAEVEVKPESMTTGVTTSIQRHIVQGILHPTFKITRAGAGKFVEEDIPHIEEFVKGEVKKIITEIVSSQPPPKERLDVLVTVSDLQNIPTEKVTTIRLTLKEADMAWTQIETKDGKTEKKLIPY